MCPSRVHVMRCLCGQVGKLEGQAGRAVGLGADAITKFFTALDAYLKDAKV